MGNNKVQERKVYIDFLKILAIYMVLFNHTNTDGFVLFTIARTSKLYPLYLFNAIFIKMAVPLFLMTSGALLLGKKESNMDVLTKRFFKYMIVLIGGGAIVYLYNCLLVNLEKISVKIFLENIYTTNITVAYWYMYTYLAYILLLPLLRKMAIAMSNVDYKWMCLMYGLIQGLSIIDFLIWKGERGHNGNFYFFISTNYVFYPLMGYYIDQRLEKEKITKEKVLCLMVLSIIAISICCFMTHYRCALIGEWNESSCQMFFETLIFIPAITVYCATKIWFENHNLNRKVCAMISAIGGTTFGIYLIEEICRGRTRFVFDRLQPYIHTLPACWIWIFVACVFGSIVTLIIKQIPGVKKYI